MLEQEQALLVRHAVVYSTLLSSTFVGVLYLAPKRIRQLNRESPQQIKWRASLAALACLLSCSTSSYALHILTGNRDLRLHVPGFLDVSRDVPSTCLVLAQTGILYLGPLSEMALELYRALKADKQLSFLQFWQSWYSIYIDPTLQRIVKPDGLRWQTLRNLLVAPVTEEIVFRYLIVSVWKATHTSYIPLLTPLFFGIAHIHHACVGLFNGERPGIVALRSAFPFTYTTAFGSYVSYAFLRRESLLAVTASHMFCNSMGLPSFGFVSPKSPLYSMRYRLWACHLVGIACFFGAFQYL